MGSTDLSPPTDDRPFFFDTARLVRIDDPQSVKTSLTFVMLSVIILVVGRVLVVDPLRAVERVSVAGAIPEVV